MDAQAEYDNRARVPDSATLLAGWARDAAAFRAAWPRATLDLPYGPGERERLDLFQPEGDADGPLALFFHGGYWQALDRKQVSHFARGLLARGVTVAMPSYGLGPAVPLAAIVDQARAAAGFLFRRRGQRLLAMGHSAGGHLAAMLLATEWAALDPALPRDLVPAALPISGVFELEPLLPTTIGAGLRLDAVEARRLSPRWLPPPRGVLHAVVGAAESNEFRRQTRDFAAAWAGTWDVVPAANHFTVLDSLTNPTSPLVARAAALAGTVAAL